MADNMNTIQERLREGRTENTDLRWHVTDIHREAADTIDELVAVLRRVVVQTGEYEREYHGSRPRSELWDSVADAKDLLAELEGK